MRPPILFIGLLILLALRMEAQTTITGVVTDSLNVPVASASVYLSKTTLGTLTDRNGIYLLSVPEKGVYEMTVSYIGFKTVSLLIKADGVNQVINIKLFVNPVLLNEITVRSKEKNRLQNYSRFVKLFLGETFNSQYCKIINPGDLRLLTDAKTTTLNGFSYKPLRIENRALGYIINYDLKDFSYNTETGFLKFEGNYFFQPERGTSRETKKWIRNRLSAYYGSRMHLFRALYSDSLSREDYKIFECKTDSLTGELQIIKPIQVNDIRLSQRNNYLTLFYDKPILITYTDNHSELYTGLTGFQSKKEISSLKFSDFINVYRNGFFDNPYSVTWGGEMSNERVADILPYDFIPDATKKIEPYEDSNISPIEKYLLLKQKSKCPDQLFVHLDRNKYKPGDTIYFQAYIRERFTNEFESKSVSLYALLFDDNRAKVDSSRFKINNSTSSGWMSVPAEAKSGKYHFVAFTSMMQNYDPSEAFQTDLSVKGKDNITGDAETSFDSEYFELKFLPEGGNSVKGIEQRIGFNATDYKGYPVLITGLLKNSLGSTLDTIKSGVYGPDLFVCTPEPGMYVEIIKGNNKEKIWPLPNPMASGICMSIKPIDNRSFSIEIQSSNYNNDTVIVSGVMNYTQIFTQDLVLNKKQRMVVETDQLLSGIAQITLFNKDLKPLAERLYYINADKHLMFNIVKGSEVYTPGQETELTISVTDGLGNPSEGTFSVSVTDSISGHDAEIYTPGIESVLNYNPYFQRNLPYKVLVTGLENLTAEDRDLMLMVYGWSRYNWDFREKETKSEDLINYDLIHIKVPGESKDHPSVKKLDLISLEGPSVKHLITKYNGEISLPLDSLLGDTRTVTLIPGTHEKKKVTAANLSIGYNPGYFKNKKFLTLQQSMPPKLFTSTSADFKISLGDTTTEIPEVIIKGYPRIQVKYQNIYEERYKYANIKSSDPELIHTSWDIENAIRRLIPAATIANNVVLLRGSTSFFAKNTGAFFVLDGMPLYSDGWSIVKTIPITEIASITVLKGNQGRTIYGLQASGGVIFINTMFHGPPLNNVYAKWKSQNKNDNLLLPINIYRPEKEFYKPTKFDIEKDPEIQSRSTIYWEPEVYFSGKEPVKLRYLNLKHHGPVIITINGASVDNLVGTGRGRYIVK